MLTSQDIHWAAGFMEGEGCFRTQVNKPRVRGNTSPAVSVVQVQRQPLEKMQRLFGGNIYLQHRPRPNHQDCHRMSWNGRKAVGIMMTLYSLMSPKRQEQIESAINAWKAAPGSGEFNRRKVACKHGHVFDEANTYLYKGSRKCRTCARDVDRVRRKSTDPTKGPVPLGS